LSSVVYEGLNTDSCFIKCNPDAVRRGSCLVGLEGWWDTGPCRW